MADANFTPQNIQAFSERLIDRLLTNAMPQALSVIPSRQLREKLVPRRHSPLTGDLFISSYWALFIEDGTRTIAPVKARFLVYYRDRDDDPRRPGGETPDRAADERRLTKAEFDAGIAENRRRAQLNPGGGPQQFMIVVANKDGGPGTTAGRPGVHFFEQLMKPFEDFAENIIYDEFEAFVLANLEDDLKNRPIVLRI